MGVQPVGGELPFRGELSGGCLKGGRLGKAWLVKQRNFCVELRCVGANNERRSSLCEIEDILAKTR